MDRKKYYSTYPRVPDRYRRMQ